MAPGSTLRYGVNEEGGHKESPDADTTKALKAFFRPLCLTLRFIYNIALGERTKKVQGDF